MLNIKLLFLRQKARELRSLIDNADVQEFQLVLALHLDIHLNKPHITQELLQLSYHNQHPPVLIDTSYVYNPYHLESSLMYLFDRLSSQS